MSVTTNKWSGSKNSTMTTMDGTLADSGATNFDSLEPGLVGSFSFNCGSTPGTYAKAIPAGQKYRVIDMIAIKAGAGGGAATVQAKRGSTAITDALDLNVADKVVVRVGTIDDSANELDGDSSHVLNIVTVSAANDPACQVDVVVKRIS